MNDETGIGFDARFLGAKLGIIVAGCASGRGLELFP
jgi:hypothetical protein